MFFEAAAVPNINARRPQPYLLAKPIKWSTISLVF